MQACLCKAKTKAEGLADCSERAGRNAGLLASSSTGDSC